MRRRLTLLLVLVAVQAAAGETVSYAKHIQPVLADRCYSCHGPEKQKGELRLDSVEAIRKGGKNGAVLVPGDVAKSTLYSLTILPQGDDDIMPAKGDPLTQLQTDRLRDWIAAGASFDGSAAVVAATAPEAAPVQLGPTTIDLASAKLAKPDAAALTALGAAGAVIAGIGGGGNALDIDLSHLGQPLDAALLKQLERVAGNVFWLDLRGSAITDAGLATVAKCRNLQRLHLDRTAITDAGLAQLAGCTSLTYLNLVGTSIGDAGLAHLARFKQLERLYLWQSKATDAGIGKLAAALPTLGINRGPGFSTVVVPDPDAPGRRRR
jgi:hypothetical protein